MAIMKLLLSNQAGSLSGLSFAIQQTFEGKKNITFVYAMLTVYLPGIFQLSLRDTVLCRLC